MCIDEWGPNAKFLKKKNFFFFIEVNYFSIYSFFFCFIFLHFQKHKHQFAYLVHITEMLACLHTIQLDRVFFFTIQKAIKLQSNKTLNGECLELGNESHIQVTLYVHFILHLFNQ